MRSLIVRRMIRIVATLLACSSLASLRADEVQRHGNTIEYQIKASYIYNFLQFVSFPLEQLDNKNIVNVCVVGENRFGNALGELNGAPVPQGKINIDYLGRYSPMLSLQACNVLYIVNNEAPNIDKILGSIDAATTLTISEYTPLVENGGIIELFVEDDSVHFKINADKVKLARYQIAAQLVELGMRQ